MDQDQDLLDLKARVAAQAAQAEVQAARLEAQGNQAEAQAAQLARLEAPLDGGAAPTSVHREGDETDGLTSRRGLFKLAGAAAVGAAGASLCQQRQLGRQPAP